MLLNLKNKYKILEIKVNLKTEKTMSEQINKMFEGIDKEKPVLIVSLVSEQTLPNIILIKALKHYVACTDNIKYLFVYTNEKKDKLKNLLDVTNLEKNDDNIVKLENEYKFNITKQNIEEKIQKFNYEQIIFNITGGTKQMSIALKNVADDYEQNKKIFYIDKCNVYNVENDSVYDLSKENLITVFEHFYAYRNTDTNIKLEQDDYPTDIDVDSLIKKLIENKDYQYKTSQILNFSKDKDKIKEIALNETNTIENKDFNNIKKYLNEHKIDVSFDNDNISEYIKIEKKCFAGKNRIKKLSINIEETITKQEIKNFLYDISWNIKNDILSSKEIKFLSGGWFEKLVYDNIKQNGNLADNNIERNIKSQKPEFELDVCFMYDNILYIIECKTVLKVGKANESIKNLEVIQKTNGIYTKKIIVTLKNTFFNDEILNKEQRTNIEENCKRADISLIKIENNEQNLFQEIVGGKNAK